MEFDTDCLLARLAVIIAERIIPRIWRRLTRDNHPTNRNDT